MKYYTIVGGVNGTGKTSLIGSLKTAYNNFGYIIDLDKLAVKHGSPLEAGRETVRRIDEYISKGICFTQETTLSGVRIERTVRRAKDAGYYIRLYYIGLGSADESIRRIANRVAKGGHDIPAQDVVRRFNNRFASLARILPYCDEATFFDNENGFIEVAVFRNGELIPTGEYRPGWLEELMVKIIL